MTNEASSNAIIGNTLRIIASGEYHPGAELTQKMASYIIELEQKLTDMSVQLANAESKCRELAAENAALKEVVSGVNSELYGQGFEVSGWHLNGALEPLDNWFTDNGWGMPETPATDAFLAEVRDSARNEGINYAASRLAAAYNHGFIGKSMSEVADVVHMILDAKTDLANSIILPADGLSGEYAEKSLAEFADQLRKDKPEGAKS